MSSTSLPCPLRTYRRTWGLTQQELADLLGVESRTQVSRLEHGKRVPCLEIALASATLFGVSLGDLFPQVAVEVEKNLREKISRLQEGFPQTTDPEGLRKRELFARALGASGLPAHAPAV